MFCSNCGQEVKSNSKYCGRCGFKLDNLNIFNKDIDQDKRNKTQTINQDVLDVNISRNFNNMSEDIKKNILKIELLEKKGFKIIDKNILKKIRDPQGKYIDIYYIGLYFFPTGLFYFTKNKKEVSRINDYEENIFPDPNRLVFFFPITFLLKLKNFKAATFFCFGNFVFVFLISYFITSNIIFLKFWFLTILPLVYSRQIIAISYPYELRNFLKKGRRQIETFPTLLIASLEIIFFLILYIIIWPNF